MAFAAPETVAALLQELRRKEVDAVQHLSPATEMLLQPDPRDTRAVEPTIDLGRAWHSFYVITLLVHTPPMWY